MLLAIKYLLQKDEVHRRTDPRYVAYIKVKNNISDIKEFIVNKLPYFIGDVIAGITVFAAIFGLQVLFRMFT